MLLIILLLTFINIITCKLVYLATLFRHGARYPLGDIYDGAQTKQFHGQLTTVGMRQQFNLGTYMKAEYIDKLKLINSTLYPKEVQVFADSSERCVQSAISHLLGLFPFGTAEYLPQGIDPSFLNPPYQTFIQQNLKRRDSNLQDTPLASQFATKMGFQPIPYINATKFIRKCPNQNKIIAKRIQSLSIKLAQFQAVHAAFTQKMRIIFKLKAQYANVAGLAQLFDVVICDLNLGRGMPVQFTDYDFRQLRYIQNYLFLQAYGGQVASIFSTSIIAAIIQNMQNKVTKGQKQVKKYSIYSGHDSNIVPILNFLNLTTPQCITRKWRNQTVVGNCADVPPFASNLIFQLHQNESDISHHYVKLRYNGEYFIPCEKTKQCQFSQFSRRLKAHFVDVVKECGITSTQEKNQFSYIKKYIQSPIIENNFPKEPKILSYE